ncbi:type II secretion system F family protein [Amorphus sp. MBR-141]
MRDISLSIGLPMLIALLVVVIVEIRRGDLRLAHRLLPKAAPRTQGEAQHALQQARTAGVDAFRLAWQTAADDTLSLHLLEVGWPWSPAKPTFWLVSAGAAATTGALLFGALLMLGATATDTPSLVAVVVSAAVGGGTPGLLVNRRVSANRRAYKRLLPDLIEMVVVCVDAGQNVDAAFERLSREFTASHPRFGLHLEAMVLEMQAGVPMHRALHALAERTRLDEVYSLVALFRQSQAWGSSVVTTLRTFASGLRKDRLLAAEERANALPVKIVFPIGLFIFPVLLVVLLAPVVVSILQTLSAT